MKIRKEYIKASDMVHRLSKKYKVNPVYIWDLLGEEFNIQKGIGGVVNQSEINEIESIIKNNI